MSYISNRREATERKRLGLRVALMHGSFTPTSDWRLTVAWLARTRIAVWWRTREARRMLKSGDFTVEDPQKV